MSGDDKNAELKQYSHWTWFYMMSSKSCWQSQIKAYCSLKIPRKSRFLEKNIFWHVIHETHRKEGGELKNQEVLTIITCNRQN